MRALYQRKNSLTEDYQKAVSEIDAEIVKLQASVDLVNEVVTPLLCKSCRGTGEESYADAAGSRDTRECRYCGGTGIKKQ